MSTEADQLAQANARIAELEGAQRAQAKTQAVTAALGKHDLNPGALEQLSALLDPTISIQRTADGRDVVMGPGFRQLEDHIQETLGKPEYAHFRRSSSGFQPTGSPAPAPAAQGLERRPTETLTEFYARAGATRPQLPGENFGQTLARIATENRSQGMPDARLDLSRPMGLRGNR